MDLRLQETIAASLLLRLTDFIHMIAQLPENVDSILTRTSLHTL
jgi:hypothetical protein